MNATAKPSARQAEKYRLQQETQALWGKYSGLFQLGETDEAYRVLAQIEVLKQQIKQLDRGK
jgi:hypothetical protein